MRAMTGNKNQRARTDTKSKAGYYETETSDKKRHKAKIREK